VVENRHEVNEVEKSKVQSDYYIYLAGLGSDFAIGTKTKLIIDIKIKEKIKIRKKKIY
jgi:hypothetical protein